MTRRVVKLTSEINQLDSLKEYAFLIKNVKLAPRYINLSCVNIRRIKKALKSAFVFGIAFCVLFSLREFAFWALRIATFRF